MTPRITFTRDDAIEYAELMLVRGRFNALQELREERLRGLFERFKRAFGAGRAYRTLDEGWRFVCDRNEAARRAERAQRTYSISNGANRRLSA